jgi:DNA-binding LytR/AlgR family response regulator
MTKLKVLIVEDEPLAAAQLAVLLSGIRQECEILAICDTIASTVNWIESNDKPDLAFFDIHLGDGLSFEVFNKAEFKVPVIFTTAYDQYALKAFKVNSIDYLLKPIDEEELRIAIDKFEQTKSELPNADWNIQLQNIVSSIGHESYKERFLVKVGTHLRAIKTSDILYFYSFEKGTYIKTLDNKNYLMDQTLEMIEQRIDPTRFFRINRKYIVSIDAINDVSIYSNSRLKLKVAHAEEDDFMVAREKVKLFKAWLEGE